MKIKSAMMSHAAGPIGGVTYSRNGATITRIGRPMIVNARRNGQTRHRANVAHLATNWREVLTEGQRLAWSNYAHETPLRNTFGDQITIGGWQMFLRCNSVRRTIGLPDVLDGPATPGLPKFTNFGIYLISDSAFFGFLLDNYEAWQYDNAAGILILGSRQKSNASFGKRGPIRKWTSAIGDSEEPPVFLTPAEDAYGCPGENLRPGRLYVIEMVVSYSDGRLSNRIRTRQRVV